MMILKTEIAPVVIITHLVFTIPRFLLTIYVGIRPPLKNIVNSNTSIRYFIHMTFRLEAQYAERALSAILVKHPTPT